MSDKLFIPIILGTSRTGRKSELVAKFMLSKLEVHPEVETKLIDPKEMDLPGDEDGLNLAEKNPEYCADVVKADGFIVISPEYNHSFSGTLKRVLDMCPPKDYDHKAVAACGVSSGSTGGARGIISLTNVFRRLGLSQILPDLYFPNVGDLFDESGNLKDPSEYEEKLPMFLDNLVWMAKTLKAGRES